MSLRAHEEQQAYAFGWSVRTSSRPSVRYTAFWSVTLFLSDLAMFVLAAYIAGSLVDHRWDLPAAIFRFRTSSILFVGVWVGIFYALGLYSRSLALSFKDEFYFTIIALTLGVIPQLLFFTAMPIWSTSRLALLLSLALAIGLVGPTRSTIHLVRAAIEKSRSRRYLIIGSASEANVVRESLSHDGGGSFVTLDVDSERGQAIRSGDDLARAWFNAAIEWRCDRIVIAGSQDERSIRQLLALCQNSPTAVTLALPNIELGTYDFELERKGSQRLLRPVYPRICWPLATLSKRILDITFSAVAIVLSAPIMLIASLAIRMESGTPILFKQERIGRYGRIFSMLKFRTMKTDADSAWAIPGDTRITRVGSILRRTSLDELPQLFNVLLGDMSLVGPRPEMRSFEERFAREVPSYIERRLALPGITGWAQVNMKRNLSPDDVAEVLGHDLFYIEHWSMFLDLTLLLKTAAEFMFHRAV